ncbi:MAG: hypothetical protein ABIU05_18090, partial [Nitrospirales bacterium]
MNERHDGKSDLQEYVARLHPYAEILIDELGPGRTYSLPQGFEVNDNSQGFSMTVQDPTRLTLFGPMGDAGVTVRVHEGSNGTFARGIDLIVAIARLLEVGPPVYQRSLNIQAKWWREQIAQCSPFLVLEPAPKTRSEMESHIDSCQTCGPVASAYGRAIDAGASIYRDADLSNLIALAHENQAEAVGFYDRKAT